MKSRHFRLIIFLGIISIVGIAVLQFYWFRQAYDVRQREFELRVSQALSGIAQEIFEFNGYQKSDAYPVEQLSDNYFVVMINDQIQAGILQDLLLRKFREMSIDLPFYYTVYDCANDNLVYGSRLMDQSINDNIIDFPDWDRDQYYFGVFFPTLKTGLMGAMKGWFVLSAVLLVAMIFFCIALIILFRQRRLSEIQKNFINNMTHELKTPLTSIVLTSEAMLKSGDVKGQTRTYSQIIADEASKLKKQVESVLAIARGQREGFELKKEHVNIQQFFEEYSTRFNQTTRKRISFTFDGIENKLNASIDPFHFEQVIFNLLDNVLKYGVENPHVRIEFSESPRYININWKENGSGIPINMARKIFKPFVRIDNTNIHNQKGFGLGLHHVKNIVKAHGGTISLEKGTHSTYFQIRIPKA